MSTREVAQFSFEGPRFESHAVLVESLDELAAFQALVREIGRWLYQRDNPGRKRVPSHFDQSLALRVRTVRAGSALVPLEAADPATDVPLGLAGLTYLERSLSLAVAACNAANEGRSLPPEFPRSALAIIDEFGKTLRPDEAFLLRTPRSEQCRYSIATRQTLLAYARQGYEDEVDLSGRVVAVDVERRSFIVHADDGSLATAELPAELEAQAIAALREHAERRVRVRGRGHFGASGDLRRIAPVDALEDVASGRGEGRPPIGEILAQIGEELPSEALDELPTDLASNLDHYLYGAPRRE
jgi:hypothetical protein